MFNLFEILQSQAGPGMQSIGQQFGLTPDQSRNAMNALLPALAAGLQHSAASDPMGFGRMLGMAGGYPGFGAPAQPQATAQPDFLGQLFGSTMLSQAVLQQASATSGIGQQALRQMLPVMAGMVVAGIVHVMVNQPPPGAPVPQRPAPPPSPEASFPTATFWNDWLAQFLGAPDTTAAGPASKAREPAPPAELPKPPEPQETSSENDASFEAFQQMFQTGVQVQEQNARAMQDIFEAFWKPAGEADAVAQPPDPQEPPPEDGSAPSPDAGSRKRTPRAKRT